MEDEPKRYIDNQVHGGAIVMTNIQAVYRAVQSGLSGQNEVFCLLMSLPQDDKIKINQQIQDIRKKYKIETEKINRRAKSACLGSQKTMLNKQFIETQQAESLEITHVVVSFLDSIGQWWLKRNAIEKGYLSLYELGEAETPDE